MSRFNGRTCFVTGATAGFGAAITRRLVSEGARVIGTGRRLDRLQALRDELGAAFLPLAFDIADRAQSEAAVAALPPAWSAVDALVNNAGLALGLEPAHQASLDDWETMVRTNCLGVLYVSRALLPGMVERGRGDVVNISSIAGSWPYPGGNVYAATKAFLTQLSLNLRADLVGTKVRVTSLEPGLSESEFSLVRFKGDAAKAAGPYAGAKPLLPEDIAELVAYVLALPPHININRLEVMPTSQAFGPFVIHRES